MSKRLEVPTDLEHLIEKRDEETDRRGTGRRSRRTSSSTDATKKPDRRKQTDRRRKPRRKS